MIGQEDAVGAGIDLGLGELQRSPAERSRIRRVAPDRRACPSGSSPRQSSDRPESNCRTPCRKRPRRRPAASSAARWPPTAPHSRAAAADRRGCECRRPSLKMGLPDSGIASGPPQLTLHPMAAASWQTENSGITTSNPSTVWPAIASAAIFSASRWARENQRPRPPSGPGRRSTFPCRKPATGGVASGDRVQKTLCAHVVLPDVISQT